MTRQKLIELFSVAAFLKMREYHYRVDIIKGKLTIPYYDTAKVFLECTRRKI